VPADWLTGLVERLAAEHGFKTDVDLLDIPGLCVRCTAEAT
jgi:hypothetical protein